MQRKIEGDIQPVGTLKDKITQETWLEKLDAVLALVPEFSWSQYTPFFNDGDACTFRYNYSYIRDDDGDQHDAWNIGYKQEDPDRKKLSEAMQAFDNASGEFEESLAEMFGDHAEVLATKDGFSVDYYEHD